MSTAEVARDFDVLRRTLGDAKLTYAGFSYGSYLGAVYANLFPDRVRALVIDGVLDPLAWAGTPAYGIDPADPSASSPARARGRLLQETPHPLRRRRTGPVPPRRLSETRRPGRRGFRRRSLKEAPLEIIDPETGEVALGR